MADEEEDNYIDIEDDEDNDENKVCIYKKFNIFYNIG